MPFEVLATMPEGAMNLSPLLLLALLMATPRGQQPSRADESPAELATRLLRDSCSADNFTAFYLQIREEQGMSRRHPHWPNNDDGDGLPGREISWSAFDEPYKDIMPGYKNFWPSISSASSITLGDYTWCVYLFSEQSDVHGCIVGNGTSWATPQFQMLGLLEKLSVDDVGWQFGINHPIVALTIDVIGRDEFPSGNLLWHNAMVTVNINWHDLNNGSVTTVGEYFILDVYKAPAQYITGISSQEKSFLVKGSQKHFDCEIHGAYRQYRSYWSRQGHESLQVLESPCGAGNRSVACEHITYHNNLIDEGNCEDYSKRVTQIGTNHMILDFRNPTTSDTGLYSCYIRRRDNCSETVTKDCKASWKRSIYVYVVFVEVFESTLNLGQQGGLRCSVKAPTDSNITVTHNNRLITTPFSSEDSNCDHMPQISTSTQPLEEGFTLFSVMIHICQVLGKNMGTYQCEVEYSIPTSSEPHYARVATDITVLQAGFGVQKAAGVGLSHGAAIAISCGVFLLCSALAALALTLCLLVLKNRQRRQGLRDSLSGEAHTYQRILDPASSPEREVDPMEVPRNLLEMHQQIGKGRFGRVVLASSSVSSLNFPAFKMVAAKMALFNTLQTNKAMISELEVMKYLGSHQNVCNLLAYCTAGGPVCIIMEHCCHGNLKEWLDRYRQAVIQSGQSLGISNRTGRHNQFRPILNIEEEAPVLLSQSDVRDLAFQIACGLEHLEAMEVVHCDLAARNILISEGFVLKIGDFGLSRRILDEDNYQNMIALDGVLAVKWAALEALESKGYTIKSDVWSYGVTIWEIATCGARPFSDHKIGVSLDRFVQFLRAGNRLHQPDGLSASIHQTLLSCWAEEPSARPSPANLNEFFKPINH